jgi:hypothetical protein
MKTYKIPCTWQMYGYYHIEAENIKEALQKAEDADLPENGEYIESSFEIDNEIIPFYNELTEEEKEQI